MATTSGTDGQLGPLLGLPLGHDLEVAEALADLLEHPRHERGVAGIADRARSASTGASAQKRSATRAASGSSR